MLTHKTILNKIFKHLLIGKEEKRKQLSQIRELNRLASLPRKTQCESTLLDSQRKIISVDPKIIVNAYNFFFEQEHCRFTSKLNPPRIIDCGANIGATVFYWKKIYPDSKIVAFEPDPEIFEVLKTNCQESSSTTLIQAGLWTCEGNIEFLANGKDGGHIAELVDEIDLQKNKVVVPVKRLRDYLHEPCSMLKIDIEGAEVDVLKDCKDLLCNVENLFVEHHSFINKPQRLGEFFSLLEDVGFRLHVFDESTAKQPFISRPIGNSKDLRINVFAFRD